MTIKQVFLGILVAGGLQSAVLEEQKTYQDIVEIVVDKTSFNSTVSDGREGAVQKRL